MQYELISEATLEPMPPLPFERLTFRNESVTVIGFTPPQHAGSTGRVTVRHEDGTTREYFPGVVGLRIVEREDAHPLTAQQESMRGVREPWSALFEKHPGPWTLTDAVTTENDSFPSPREDMPANYDWSKHACGYGRLSDVILDANGERVANLDPSESEYAHGMSRETARLLVAAVNLAWQESQV